MSMGIATNHSRAAGGEDGRAARITGILFAGSLLPALVGVGALVASGRAYWPHANALIWYGLLGLGLLALVRRKACLHGWRAGVFLSLATLNVLILAPEIYLRLAGFRHESGIRFGGSSRFSPLVESESLFWTLPPDTLGVNSQGFKTLPLPRLEEPGLTRVVFLGDSVAYQGYPEVVGTLLNSRNAGKRYEILNMSLGGYSSHQGRVVVDTLGDAMAADLAVIAYGWNDHWLTWGDPDEQRVERPAKPAGRLAAAILRRSRIAQAARYLLGRRSAGEAGAQLRVSPSRFRENLLHLGDYWDKRGVQVIFLTLPSAHDRFGVPNFLIEQGLARNKETVLALHRTYNQIVRQVAGEGDWPLLDLERQLDSFTPQDLGQIFLADGIHLSVSGLALFADRVAARIADLTLARISEARTERPDD